MYRNSIRTNSYHYRMIVTILILCNCLFAGLKAGTAYADAAPPPESPGSDISPTIETQVQMVAERVEFDVHPLTSWREGYIQITAEFIMRNQGNSIEQMKARFPVMTGCYGSPEIEDFRVSVNGKLLETTQTVELPDSCIGDDVPIGWANFDVTFPIEQSIVLRVTYHLSPVALSQAYGAFNYLLETGAGWYGPIGKADFVLRLPYIATAENAGGGWEASPTLTPQYIQNEVRWHAENFEPTSSNNLHLHIIYPDKWQNILDAQAQINAGTEIDDAYLQLGQAYFSAGARFHGYMDSNFLQLSLKAYEEALKFTPYSAEANANVANVLWWLEDVTNYPLCPEHPDFSLITPRLSLALAIDPNNSTANYVLSAVSGCAGSSFVLPTYDPNLLPTSTITQTPTQTLTPTTVPTLKPMITATPSATKTIAPPTATQQSTEPSPSTVPTATLTPMPSNGNTKGQPLLWVGTVIVSVLIGILIGVVGSRKKTG